MSTSGGCADCGYTRDLYIENLGLVQRGVNSFAGEQLWRLVSARVGPLTFSGESGASFGVFLDRSAIERDSQTAIPPLRVTLRLSAYESPVDFGFAGYPLFDFVVRDANRKVVYNWSEGRAFPLAIVHLVIEGEQEYALDYGVVDRNGVALPDGSYTLEAWMTPSRRAFSATAAFEVQTRVQRTSTQPAAVGQRPGSARR